jgi:hypothetical protein
MDKTGGVWKGGQWPHVSSFSYPMFWSNRKCSPEKRRVSFHPQTQPESRSPKKSRLARPKVFLPQESGFPRFTAPTDSPTLPPVPRAFWLSAPVGHLRPRSAGVLFCRRLPFPWPPTGPSWVSQVGGKFPPCCPAGQGANRRKQEPTRCHDPDEVC